ncbi:MAG: hypothetical protein WCF85_14795 [Rhodospirillaceae bacterium]
MEALMWGFSQGAAALPDREDIIRTVAAHERLPAPAAQEKLAGLLEQPWGTPAIRQMIRDEIDHAVANSRWPEVEALLDSYQWCCGNLPKGVDRRKSVRETRDRPRSYCCSASTGAYSQ